MILDCVILVKPRMLFGCRKRVNVIMGSKLFREELEQLVAEQMKTGPHPSSLLALQQISELILPQYKMRQSGTLSKRKNTPPLSALPPLPTTPTHETSTIRPKKSFALLTFSSAIYYHTNVTDCPSHNPTNITHTL